MYTMEHNLSELISDSDILIILKKKNQLNGCLKTKFYFSEKVKTLPVCIKLCVIAGHIVHCFGDVCFNWHRCKTLLHLGTTNIHLLEFQELEQWEQSSVIAFRRMTFCLFVLVMEQNIIATQLTGVNCPRYWTYSTGMWVVSNNVQIFYCDLGSVLGFKTQFYDFISLFLSLPSQN